MGEIYSPFVRMKNTLFVLFVVLVALLPVILMATCDLWLVPGTDGEQQMVRLAISLGDESASRKLIGTADTVDRYEVVFNYKGEYYEAEWTSGTVSITIPTGNYTDVENSEGNGAVLFAGKDDGTGTNYTLLAVGIISQVDGTAISELPDQKAYIHSTTESVTFIMTALTNFESDGKTPTFKITEPLDYATGTYGTGTYFTMTTGSYPVFPIPGTNYSDLVNTTIATEYRVFIPNSTAVKLLTAWTANTASLGGTGTTVITILTPMTLGAALTTTGECIFSFQVDKNSITADGLCAVSIDAQVYALSTSATLAITGQSGQITTRKWHIRGGIYNETPDGIGDEGGAVLLGVGWTKP